MEFSPTSIYLFFQIAFSWVYCFGFILYSIEFIKPKGRIKKEIIQDK